jgi:flagellar assembly protein FliH
VVTVDALPGERVRPYPLKEVVPLKEPRLNVPGGDSGARLAAIEQQAYERGFRSGEHAGRDSGLKEVERNYQVLLPLITELKNLKEVLLTAAERDVLAMAIAIAKHVVRVELSQNQEVVLGYVREAIKRVGPTDTILIRIHPKDVERLTLEHAKLLQLSEGIKWLKLEGDARLHPGECVVETHDRVVDAQIESQVSIIEKMLLQPK